MGSIFPPPPDGTLSIPIGGAPPPPPPGFPPTSSPPFTGFPTTTIPGFEPFPTSPTAFIPTGAIPTGVTSTGFTGDPTLIPTDPITTSFANPMYPGAAYCDGAFAIGMDPAKQRFQSKRLEEAYKHVVCECDPKAIVSCRCDTPQKRIDARAKAEIALAMVSMALSLSNIQGLPDAIDDFLQRITKTWVVVVINENIVFAFNGCASRKQRRCVARGMLEEIAIIAAESNRKFGVVPLICEKKCSRKPKDGRCPRKDKCCSRKDERSKDRKSKDRKLKDRKSKDRKCKYESSSSSSSDDSSFCKSY